ncbi:hypothetical protein CGZ95_19055 [Enemella evansiae]|uniref:hypothetical protein n=1 Tax=Enemella evansiae TaxID=2016499 RepID=UPI000B97A158|nr:hypothetical protein [Enemella evansiae]OYN93449.1 hypothetical protein CGZ95_19055 [Enemella evansiae]
MRVIKILVFIGMLFLTKEPPDPQSDIGRTSPTDIDNWVARRARQLRKQVFICSAGLFAFAIALHAALIVYSRPFIPESTPGNFQTWASLITKLAVDPRPGALALAVTGVTATIFIGTAARSHGSTIEGRARGRALDGFAAATATVAAIICWLSLPFAVLPYRSSSVPEAILIALLGILNGALPPLTAVDRSHIREQLASVDRRIRVLEGKLPLLSDTPSGSGRRRYPLRTIVLSTVAGYLPALVAPLFSTGNPKPRYWLMMLAVSLLLSASVIQGIRASAADSGKLQRLNWVANYQFFYLLLLFVLIWASAAPTIPMSLLLLAQPAVVVIVANLRRGSAEMVRYRRRVIERHRATLIESRIALVEALDDHAPRGRFSPT